jgi:hypothetical protein
VFVSDVIFLGLSAGAFLLLFLLAKGAERL